jgi:hypothetical protein
VALAQGGEFAFVLLGFAVGARVMDAELSRLLTAVVAVSMAATPLVLAAYERLVLEPRRGPGRARAPALRRGRPGRHRRGLRPLRPDRHPPADRQRLQGGAAGFRHRQIDLIRRFGWRVHYGDASRLDLLRTAGAEKAKLLVIAIDDATRPPRWSRPPSRPSRPVDHRPRLGPPPRLRAAGTGADEVERETFESALNFGRTALERWASASAGR